MNNTERDESEQMNEEKYKIIPNGIVFSVLDQTKESVFVEQYMTSSYRLMIDGTVCAEFDIEN